MDAKKREAERRAKQGKDLEIEVRRITALLRSGELPLVQVQQAAEYEDPAAKEIVGKNEDYKKYLANHGMFILDDIEPVLLLKAFELSYRRIKNQYGTAYLAACEREFMAGRYLNAFEGLAGIAMIQYTARQPIARQRSYWEETDRQKQDIIDLLLGRHGR